MKGINRYRASQANNAPKQQIVTLLFREAVKRLARVSEVDHAFGADEITDLAHVRAIFNELLAGLDQEAAPELFERLAPLYQWCIRELVEAVKGESKRQVADVLVVTETLLDGWRSAVNQPAKQSA